MGFWLRWSWRDLRQRWVLVVAIAMVIAIGTGLYTGIGSLESWRRDSNDASFALLRAHDLKLTLPDGSYTERGRLESVVGSAAGAQVEASQERLAVPTQVDASTAGRAILTPGRIVGVEGGPARSQVDGIAISAGRGLRPADRGRPVAVLEKNFADFYELPPRGRIRLSGGSGLDYVGQGTSPEYFLIIKPGAGGFGSAEAGFAVVFTSLRTAQRLAGRPGAVNELVMRLRPGADPTRVEVSLRRALARRLPGVGAEITSLPDEPAHRILYKDAEGDQRIFNVFAYLILAGAALAAFNLASRVVEAQRREIGIGMALGVGPAKLAIRPLLLGAEIALAGVVFGVALGLVMGGVFRGALEDLLPLPVINAPFEPSVFLRGALLGFLLPFAATALPVWRALRVQPVEAIRVGFRSAKSGGLAPLAKRIRLPGRSLAQMPLRNVARAPRRTLMTLLGIAAVVTVLVGLLGMIDSFLATADRSAEQTEGDAPQRLIVGLEDFTPVGSPVLKRIERTPQVGSMEPTLTLPGRLGRGDEEFEIVLELLSADSGLWLPTASEGALRSGRPGLMISRKAADDLGVDLGDRVELTRPVRTGRDRLGLARAAVAVTAIHPDPFRTFAYMDSSQAASMKLAGAVNGVDVLPAPGSSQDEVKRALFGVPGVASVEVATESIDLLRDRVGEFVGVLRVVELFALLLALLIAFNSTSITLDERARESATMFAFGVPLRTVLRIAVVESMLTGVMGTLLGALLGVAVVGWVVNVVTPSTLPELGVIVVLGAGTVLTAIVVGVLAVSLAPLLTLRRLRRMDLSATLRVVE